MTSFTTHLHGKYCDDFTWRMVNRTIEKHCQTKDSITGLR